MGRWKRALLRGRPALHWRYIDDCLVLRGPRGEETDVPVPHLIDDALMAEHYSRLRSKSWVTEPQIAELVLMAEGART